jgi:hypothetical protein
MKANELIRELQKLVRTSGNLELRLMIIDHDDAFHFSPVYTAETEDNMITINGVPPNDRVY